MPGIVTVFGGTGFLGRTIIERLASDGLPVRVAARRPEAAAFHTGGDIQPIHADVGDEASIATAVDGAQAVVNAVGLYVERGRETFKAVHVEGAARIARLSSQAGVARLVHISGIGVDPRSPSAYVRARAAGEDAACAAFEGATVLRPSVLFGPGDAFFTPLAAIARLSPVWPLFGRGETRVQPVFVDDVAEAVAKVLANEATPGHIYELGGPDIFTYRELIELLLAHIDRRRVMLPVPFALWRLLATLTAVLPSPPVTHDQLALISRDNMVGPNSLSFRDLGIEPKSARTVLPTYIPAGN